MLLQRIALQLPISYISTLNVKSSVGLQPPHYHYLKPPTNTHIGPTTAQFWLLPLEKGVAALREVWLHNLVPSITGGRPQTSQPSLQLTHRRTVSLQTKKVRTFSIITYK